MATNINTDGTVNAANGVTALNNISDLDPRKAPIFTSRQDALDALDASIFQRVEGLPLKVKENGKIVHYIFDGGTADSNFVLDNATVTQESQVFTLNVSAQTGAKAVETFNNFSTPIEINDPSSFLIKTVFADTTNSIFTTRIYGLISKPLNKPSYNLSPGIYGSGFKTIDKPNLEILRRERTSSSQDIEEIANEVIDLGNIDPNDIVTHINTVLSPDKTIADSASSVTLIKSVQSGNQTDYIYIGSGGNYGANSSTNITLADLQLVEQETEVVEAIPLSGTEDGSPVTGDIEIENDEMTAKIFSGITDFQADEDEFKSVGFKANQANNEYFIGILSQQEGILLYDYNNIDGDINIISPEGFKNKSGSYESTLELTDLNLQLNSNNPDFKGLSSNTYFGANYDENTYVQKKYVDELNKIYKDLNATGNITFSAKEKKVSFLRLTGDIVIDYTDNPPVGIAYTVYNRIDYQRTARSVSLPVTATPANTKIAGDTLGNDPTKIYGVTSIIHNVNGTFYIEHIVNKF